MHHLYHALALLHVLVVIGENKTFMGEEALLNSRGVATTVLNDAQCIEMMENFIRDRPKLWNEDIGV